MKQKMTSTKKGLKIVAALFVFMGLSLLAGLWRLKDAPLRLPVHFDVIRSLVQHQGVDFQDIYLFTPSLWSLPGVLIEKGHFENAQIQLTADQIFIHWKLRDFFSPKKLWKIDAVHLEKPTLRFKEHKASETGTFDFPVSSLTLKGGRILNLPSGGSLPAHKINATFYQQKGEKTMHFYARTLGDTHKTIMEGSASIGTATGQGTLKISNVLLAEWSSFVPKGAQHWLNFFQHPFPEIAINFKGDFLKSKGTIAAKIQAPFMDQDQRYAVPITINMDIVENPASYQVDVTMKTDPFSWTALPSLWPPFLSPTVHHWCTKRIQGGTATPIVLNTHLVYEKEPHHMSLASLEGSLGVKDTTVTYIDGMPPVEHVTAAATFSPQDFTIQILEGATRDLKVQPSSVVRFYDLETEKPQGIVDLSIDGPLPDALWVADHPPLSFISPYGFKPEATQGQSRNHLVLKFPTHSTPTAKTMNTTFESAVSNFALQVPLLGHTLTLTKGDLTLYITPQKLSVSGTSLLNGTLAKISWEENTTPKASLLRRYVVKTALPLEELLRFTPPLVADLIQKRPEFSLKGTPKLVLDYKEFPKDKSHLLLQFDFYPGVIDIPLLLYTKNANTPGQLDVDLSFHKGQIERINALKAIGPNFSLTGTALFQKNGDLQKFTVKELNVHQSKIQGTLEKNKGQWLLDLKGPQLELFPLVDFYQNLPHTPDDSQKKSTPFILTANFSKLILQKDVTLPALRVRMEWKKDGLYSYGFLIKDKEKDLFSLHYGPQKEKETIEFKTTILEQLLKGLDLTETIASGDLSFSLEKTAAAEMAPFKGKMQVESLRIKGASILAKLLSLLSIEGILSTLSGEGILFMRGDADFEYLDKKIAVQHLELTSSSLGLTGKGYIDLKESTIDVEGYIIPANILNQLIGNIPLIGRLLSGNSKEHKGLVSMSYSMKGPLKDPEVSSNPLSALAPNFVKGLFSHLTGSSNNTPSLEGGKKAS